MVSQTREITWRTLVSRRGVPSGPRKYLLTTTLVAICDQAAGTSQSRCSKTVSPFSLPIVAVRSSHWTSSKGWTPARVKRRSTCRPPEAVPAVVRRAAAGLARPAAASPLRPARTPRTSAAGRGAWASMSSEDPEEGRGLSTTRSPMRTWWRLLGLRSPLTASPEHPGRVSIIPHLGVTVAEGP